MAIKIGNNVYLAETCALIGNVTISDGVSIFDSAVLRADQSSIFIGENSNVQDNATIHVEFDNETLIGKNVSIGHNAIVHGATVKDNVIIGMGAIVMSGSILESGTVVGAGALVTGGFHSPENSLLMGLPAKVAKQDVSYLEYATRNAKAYEFLRDGYLSGKYEKRYGKSP